MRISAEIVEDSICPQGNRLTTFLLTYPRIIHSEVMTHRAFSRNASSSRAIPILTMLKAILKDMAGPVEYGSNKPGMQAGQALTGFRLWAAKTIWAWTGLIVVAMAWLLSRTGVHKQVANRMLEPWSHITVVLTATDFANFFALRLHEDADPTLRVLAREMHAAYRTSTPVVRQPGEWHLPFVTFEEREREPLKNQLVLSVARCASTSYNKVGTSEKIRIGTALKIWEKLVDSQPVHASPLEHQATPFRGPLISDRARSNLWGWHQFRKNIPGETIYEENRP